MSPKQQVAESQAPTTKAGILPTPMDVIMMPKEQWDRIKEVANGAFQAGMLPRCIKDAQAAFMVALKGYEMGFSVTYALEHILIVNGKASIDAQAMMRLIQERSGGGKAEDITPEGQEDKLCILEFTRPKHRPRKFKFTLEDARKADLAGKECWKKYPRAMLRWRALSEGARFYFSDIMSGVRYTHEEMGLEVDAEGNWTETARPAARATRDVPASVESATSNDAATSPAEQPAAPQATLPAGQQPAQVLSFTKNSPAADKEDFVRVSKLAEERGIALDRVEELAEKDMGINLADEGAVTKQHINRLSFLINQEARAKK